MSGSLKRRLLWILVNSTLFIWALSALLLYWSSGRALEEQIDLQLKQYGHVVTYISRVYARQIDEGLPLYETWSDNPLEALRERPMIIEGTEDEDVLLGVNVWLSGKLIALIEGSPDFGPPTAVGFDYATPAATGGEWRVLTHYDKVSDVWIRVGIEFASARRAMLLTQAEALLPLLLVLPLTLVVIYLGVSRGLLPLNNLARQVYRRNPAELEPVDTGDVPAEVEGVVDSINTLLERLAYAMESEQRFTANAAHELMTPLAAIKAEVQLCQRRLQRTEDADMLARIAQRVDRATHMVEQLLTLARVEPEAEVPKAPVPLRALLLEVLADTGHLAAVRGLSVELAEGPEVELQCNAEGVAILMRNLLVNAFRYASENSEVSVSLNQVGGVELAVCNDCEPLSAAEFRQIADRFYRVPGNTEPGSGLGLSIVSRIAELHGARFIAEPRHEGRGFCARVMFPGR